MGLIDSVSNSAGNAGSWAWNNKGEVGFWVGMGALVLGLPIAGGAAGAARGGLLAGRGAGVASRIAQTGRVGAIAVDAARAGASLVRGTSTRLAAMPVGGAISRANATVHAGRVALGATPVGRAMIAAQRPVTVASTVLAGVNLADNSIRFARGDGSLKDVALSSLGFAPGILGGIRGAAARRAATANARAADVATSRLGAVAQHAAGATEDVAHVATVAPRVNAPRTAGAAAVARDEAASTLDKAIDVQRLAAQAETVDATTLVRELDEVAGRARAAQAHAAHTAELAPDDLTPIARDAGARLGNAEALATSVTRDIAGLATVQRRADLVADRAELLGDAVGTTSMHAANVNNGLKGLHDHRDGSLADGSFLRGLTSWILGRNARGPTS